MLRVQLIDIGLLLNLIGAALIFLYGLSPLLSRDGSLLLSVGKSEHLERKARHYSILSRLGISSIFAGSALQLLGNHVNWAVDTGMTALCLSLVSGAIVITAVALMKRHWRRRYDLRACYHPQFGESKQSLMHTQMWIFVVTNNSKRMIETAELYLNTKAQTATIYCDGEEPRTVNNSRKISLEKIQAGRSVKVHAWNIGGHQADGHDCYLSIKGRVVRPKVYYFE